MCRAWHDAGRRGAGGRGATVQSNTSSYLIMHRRGGDRTVQHKFVVPVVVVVVVVLVVVGSLRR